MRKLFCLAAVCAALACKREPPAPVETPQEAAPKGPSAPLQVDEQEPDDYQHAMAIPPRSVVTGSLAPPRPRTADEDWYRIEAQKTLALHAELKQVGGAALDASLEVYDRDRNALLHLHVGGADKGVIPAVACVQACFVKVSGRSPAKYQLTVLGAAPAAGQELEPNDRAVDANELAPGKPITGTILSPEDEDWYRLTVPPPQPGQYLRVEVTGVEGVRPQLEVRALSDGTLLASARANLPSEGVILRDLSLHLGEPAPDAGVADAGTGDAGSADAGLADGGVETVDAGGDAGSPADAGTDAGLPDGGAADAGAAAAAGYYLVVKSAWYTARKPVRGAAPTVPYTLTATVESGPPDLEVEPNDDPQHATPVGQTATGYLAPAGDQDWYRIHADAPAVLHAELTGVDRADLELSVWAAPQKPGDKPALLARANERGPREGEVLPAVGVPAGDSYVLVQSALRELDGKRVRDGEDPDHPYKLSLALANDDGSLEREPNDNVASAQTVPLPATVKGWIWPRKDVDFFRFHVPAGHPPVNITLPAVRGMDLQLRLYEVHEGGAEVIGSSDVARGEGDEKLLSVPLKEGDYAVEVASPRNKDASATQPYTLSIQ